MFSSTLTILVIGAFLCIIMLMVLWSLLRTGIGGVREWVVANALAVVAFLLYAFGKSLPPLIAYELTNAFNAAVGAALLLGFRRFYSLKTPLSLLALGVALVTIAIGVFHYIIDSFALRTLTVAVYQGIIFLGVALTIFTANNGTLLSYPYLFTGFMAALVATGHLTRGVIFLIGPDIPSSLLQPSPWNLFFLSASTLVQPVLTLGAIMMVHDAMMRKAEHAANRDLLTGAWSRRAFFERAQQELARARRTGKNLTLLRLDVNHFREINDRFGHAAGDQALVDIVRKGEAALRDTDCLGRIGDNEFAILLPEANHQGGNIVAQRLQKQLASTVTAGAPYSVRMGLATLKASESFEELLLRAGTALSQAKASGRGLVSGEADPAFAMA